MKRPSITSLPPSPSDDRRARMRTYAIMMAVRIVCLFALLFVRGWWVWICVAGAVFLPYVAVLLANATASPLGETVQKPDAIVRARAADSGSARPDAGADAGAENAGAAPGPAADASGTDGQEHPA